MTTAGLVEPLESTKQLTVFAPVNSAFEAIKDVAAGLSVEQLTAVLGYHVVEGAVVYSTDIKDGASVKTLQGEEIKLTLKDGDVLVNEAKVVIPNVLVKNGVVHAIDGYVSPHPFFCFHIRNCVLTMVSGSVLIPKNLGGDDSATPSSSGTASGTASATSTGAPTNTAVTAGAGVTIASFGVALAAGAFAALLQL